MPLQRFPPIEIDIFRPPLLSLENSWGIPTQETALGILLQFSDHPSYPSLSASMLIPYSILRRL